MCDGRADRGRVYLRLTEVHLPGLNDVDAQDRAVLGAYVTAFATTLRQAGYRSGIVTVARPPGSNWPPTT